jgi:hypothetical protein
MYRGKMVLRCKHAKVYRHLAKKQENISTNLNKENYEKKSDNCSQTA